MKTTKPDIASRADLVSLLRTFYTRAQQNNIIGPKFVHLDMDHHIEIIANFWDSVLFGTQKYQGDPFGKHIPLALTKVDFSTWLTLFTETLNERFEGKNAAEIQLRAETIARVFQHKLNLY